MSSGLVFCDNCGKLISSNEIQFMIKIEIFASPGSLEFTEEEIQQNHISKMKELIEALEDIDVEEATDEVWEGYKFILCKKCRIEFHKNLKIKSKEM